MIIGLRSPGRTGVVAHIFMIIFTGRSHRLRSGSLIRSVRGREKCSYIVCRWIRVRERQVGTCR